MDISVVCVCVCGGVGAGILPQMDSQEADIEMELDTRCFSEYNL